MSNKKISKERKLSFYIGTGLIVIGFVLFISVFFSFFAVFQNSMNDFGDNVMTPFLRAPIGIVLIICGTFLRNIGSRGLAGSGVILDPEKAREDLKPHAKAVGGIISDALEEVDVLQPAAVKEIIKIKCSACGALNEELAKFCAQCGEKI